MRVFWAMMAALVLATGGLLALRGRGSEGPASLASRTTETPETTAPEATAPKTTAEKPGMVGEATQLVEPSPAPDEPAGTDAADEPGETVVVDIGRADEAPAEPTSEPTLLAEDTREDTGPEASIEAADAAADDETAEAEIAEAPAGTTLLDGRHAVPGSGTEADPYVVDFDVLVALEQDYEPKTEGKEEVPEWIKALDGKHVTITGFVAFPFIAPSSDECMVMLNQWDGCCIGVPPTPYDAVEVQLGEPVDLTQGVPNYGTVTGVFRTDPYLVNGWLIGLYLMEDARLLNPGSKNQAGF